MEKQQLLENTKKYRGTPKGVLTNMYGKMKSRRIVEFTLDEFHDRFLTDNKFIRLHKEWIKSGKDKMKKPSLDRISNKKGYTVKNTHMLTWAENRHKQVMERRSRKGSVIQYLNGKEIAKYRSQREAVRQTGISQGSMSEHMNGKRPHVEGFIFKFESEVIGSIYENKELLEKII
jgi:hypothetical protein